MFDHFYYEIAEIKKTIHSSSETPLIGRPAISVASAIKLRQRCENTQAQQKTAKLLTVKAVRVSLSGRQILHRSMAYSNLLA